MKLQLHDYAEGFYFCMTDREGEVGQQWQIINTAQGQNDV